MHVFLVKVRRKDLDVAASTVNLLLMLDSELDDQGFSLITERLKAGGQGIKVGILAGLET